MASVFADRYEQPILLIAYGTAAFISVSRVYLSMSTLPRMSSRVPSWFCDREGPELAP